MAIKSVRMIRPSTLRYGADDDGREHLADERSQGRTHSASFRYRQSSILITEKDAGFQRSFLAPGPALVLP